MSAKTAKTSAAGSPAETPPSFETALAELEGIVEQMEAGELTLEQSLAQYKRGAELLKFCQSALADAQTQIKVLDDGVLKDLPGDV
jgi:exodeoxyribonuclease VII small subunit